MRIPSNSGNYLVQDKSDDCLEQVEKQLKDSEKKKDFVLVQFLIKTATKYYVGGTIQKYDDFEYKREF